MRANTSKNNIKYNIQYKNIIFTLLMPYVDLIFGGYHSGLFIDNTGCGADEKHIIDEIGTI